MTLPLFWNVIINPNTLNYKKEKLWNAVKTNLLSKGFLFKEFISPSQQICEQLTADLLEAEQTNFIVVGGDGTLNEVINALIKNNFNADKILLALIPSGTGNDWSRTHQIPPQSDALADMFINGKFISHDLGKVSVQNNNDINERYFINIAGLGFDAEVILRLNKSTKLKYAGQFIYLKNLFFSLLTNKPNKCSFVLDDISFEKSVFSIAVGICKYNGGGMMQVPMANHQDGLLDMIIIEPMNLYEILVQLPKLYKGKHIGFKKVHHYRTKKVNINPQKKMFAEMEGEIAGDGTFEITSIAEKVRIVVP